MIIDFASLAKGFVPSYELLPSMRLKEHFIELFVNLIHFSMTGNTNRIQTEQMTEA